MKNRTKYILLALYICFVVIAVQHFKKGPFRACKLSTEDILKLEMQAIVIDKYEDKRNHGNETVVVSQQNNQKVFYLIGDISGLFDSICVGDSIYKKLNSMDFLLVRDTIEKRFSVDFDCENIRGWD